MMRKLISPLAVCVALSVAGAVAADESAPQPPITALAFSPDGKSLVVGSQAGLEIRPWPALKIARRLPTELVQIHDAAFAPDGSRLAVAGGSPSESGGVEIFAWPSGQRIARQEPHEDVVYSVRWRESGELLTASLDRTVAVVSLSEPAVIRRFAGHSRGVLAVACLPRSQYVVSAGIDRSLRVWNADTGERMRSLNNHTRAVVAAVLRPAQEIGSLPMLATAGRDTTVRLWQPTIGRMVRFARLDAVPLDLAWLPGGDRLLAACSDGHVYVISADTAKVLANRPAVDGWAYSLAVSPQGNVAVAGGGGQLVGLPDLSVNAEQPALE